MTLLAICCPCNTFSISIPPIFLLLIKISLGHLMQGFSVNKCSLKTSSTTLATAITTDIFSKKACCNNSFLGIKSVLKVRF